MGKRIGDYEIEIEDRPTDDRSKAICIERADLEEQFTFEVQDGSLLYQGPMNADAMTWTEVPDGIRELAEGHFGTKLTADTEDLIQRREANLV
ncbi:hypothetical protein [Halovenus sp. HT40]|uniref:hypothetical protein n=1 Tax=Halovenus sp. HT40 TaxID=3126691 RepID=UPI00300F312B